MTKHTAPFTLRFMTSSSESSFAVPALDSYSIKDYINTITHNSSNISNKGAKMKISGTTGMPLLKIYGLHYGFNINISDRQQNDGYLL